MAWDDIEGLDRWAVEIECPDPDDVLRLVEETSGDDAVLGWSPAPKEIPAAWFMADEAYQSAPTGKSSRSAAIRLRMAASLGPVALSSCLR